MILFYFYSSHNGLKAKIPTATQITSGTGSGPPKRGHQKDENNSSSHSSHQSLAHRAIESFNNKVQSLSSKLPKKAWQEDPTSDDEGKTIFFGNIIKIVFLKGFYFFTGNLIWKTILEDFADSQI